MTTFLRRAISKLPKRWQRELRRAHFARKIRRKAFFSKEPEFELLDRLVKPGHWVIDIGANVGHYTAKMSSLVGPAGRVLALEPVSETFAILAWNLQYANCQNVTLINAAASDESRIVKMQVPQFKSGMDNYYQARITDYNSSRCTEALSIRIGDFKFPKPVSLIKIDVEGHELAVLAGLESLLRRDRPILILETDAQTAPEILANLGYLSERLPSSPNLLCHPTLATNR